MYEQLTKLKDANSIVAIYTNENDGDVFSVGYICELKQDKVLLLNVGVHGEYDGYTAMYVDDIFRIETDSKYLDKIKKLMTFNVNEKMLEANLEDVFVFLLNKAVNDNNIFAIQYNNDSEIRGYVKEIKNVLSVIEIDEYGCEDGKNIINIRNINKIVVDDVECRDLEKLYQFNRFKD